MTHPGRGGYLRNLRPADPEGSDIASRAALFEVEMPEILRTACNRDCPDACGIVATVEDGRVLSIAGDKEHPVTRGFLCERTSRYLARQYSPDRLTRPLVRRDGRLVEASWDAALDLVAAELRRIRGESGPEAVLHYRSGGSLGLLKTVNDWFFECFGGARVKKGDICSGAGEAAQEADLGVSDSNALEDLVNSRCIVLWGKNVVTSFVHMLPAIKEARRRGARVILIDPVPNKTAGFADVVLQPRPGSDRFLALGVARVLYDRGYVEPTVETWSVGHEAFRRLAHRHTVAEWARAADVPERDVGDLGETYGLLRPGNIQVGWGLQRRKWGATTIRILDALGALTGNYGVSGGGVTFNYKRRSAFTTTPYKAPPERRGIPEALLGSGILEATDPPVRAVVIDNGNPVAMLPDSRTVARALETRELVVVLEQFLTDTAQCAHVVLPVTTLLEESDVLGAFGHHQLIASNPVAARPAEVRSDLEIYQALAERLGFGERLAGTHAEWSERLLEPVRDRVSLQALQRGAVRNPLAPPVLFEGQRFKTPDGRFHFVTEVALEEDRPPSGFALQLGCFSTPKAQSSQWSVTWDGRPIEARCHPQSSRGLRDGDVVQVTSRIGSMRVTLRLDATLRRDMLLVPKGGWLEHGCAANVLVRAETTDLGLGAVYYDEWVRLDQSRNSQD